MTKLYLIVRGDGESPREVPVVDGLTVGRSSGNQLVITGDDSVGRNQFRVVSQDGTWVIEDLHI